MFTIEITKALQFMNFKNTSNITYTYKCRKWFKWFFVLYSREFVL